MKGQRRSILASAAARCSSVSPRSRPLPPRADRQPRPPTRASSPPVPATPRSSATSTRSRRGTGVRDFTRGRHLREPRDLDRVRRRATSTTSSRRSSTMSQGRQDADDRRSSRTSSGRTARRSRRPTSPTASTIGKQDKFADRIGLTSPTTQHRLVRVAGQEQGRDPLQGGRLDVRRARSSRTSGSSRRRSGRRSGRRRTSRTRTPSARARSPKVSTLQPAATTSCRRTRTTGRRGYPKIECIERIAASSNDAALLQHRQRAGRLVAQLLSERRVRRSRRRIPKHYHNSYLTTDLPVALFFDTTEYPYSLAGVPEGRQPRDRPQDGVEARRVRLRARRRARSASSSCTRSGSTRRSRPGEGDGRLRPGRGEEGVHGRRLHVQERRPLRPEGRSRQLPDPRDRRLVRLGRVTADHLAEPAGRRHRRVGQARARLGRVAAERDEHEDRDAALDLRRERHHAVGVLLLALRPVPEPRQGRRRVGDRQLGALLERRRERRS